MTFSHVKQQKPLDIQKKNYIPPSYLYTKFLYFSDVNWKAYIFLQTSTLYISNLTIIHSLNISTKQKENKMEKIPCRGFSVSSARRTPIRILLAIHLEASGLSRSRVAGLCSHRNDDLLLRFVNFGLDTPLELHNRGCYGDVYLVLLKI